MPDTMASSTGARAAGLVLGVLCLLLWVIVVAPLFELGRSDAAGNAMAQGFAAIGLILLWILLSILALVAGINGAMPSWARAALLLVPASGVAALTALDLLGRPGNPPWHWPMIVPALVPPLIVTYCVWALLRPPMTGARAGAFLGAIAVLSLAIVPLYAIRSATVAQEQTTSANLRAALAALPADAPLWDFTPFLAAHDQTIVSDAVTRIQTLGRRQGDAEAMLARGDFPLRHLAWFDLDYAPSLCEKARAQLRKRAEALVPAAPGTKPYGDIAQEVADALSALSWLVGYGCNCDAESLAWEKVSNAYRDTSYDVVSLARLREPAELGRKLREDPDKFSQLSAQSHLKAWLKFANDGPMREKVIVGARALPRRTADAVEMLTDKYQENGRFRLLSVLPEIDLEATPALCAAATKEAGTAILKVWRPKPGDEPRPYSELIDRLGAGDPLATLIWLGEHGCDVATELRGAEAAVRAYQDSPARAVMLATLARLQAPR